jgi:cyanoexosortase A
MKVTHPLPAQLSRKSQYWLLATAAALVTIYMTLVWLSGDVTHLGMSILFYIAAGTVLAEKRRGVYFEKGVFPKVIGVLIIGILIWQSVLLLHNPALTDKQIDPLLRLFPFGSMLGIGLLVSDFKKLKQYWRELTILFHLGGPSVLALFLPDFSPVTAWFSAFLLQLTGFNATVQDVSISISGIETSPVYAGCSGIESMTYLLGLSVISLILFPIARIKQITVPLLAILIGFAVNAARVAFLSILEVFNDESSFTYWHEGDGSLAFGIAAILIFAFCYWLLYQQEKSNSH